MSNNIITIDLDKYCTQVQYSKERDIKLSTVSQWVKRVKSGKPQPIEILEIPELNGLTLVKR